VKAKRLFRLWHFYSAQVSGVIYSYNVDYRNIPIIVASSAFVPTNAQNRLSACPPKICFCLLGQRPKPFEQPRGWGWLRVRFTNAVLPGKGKTGRSDTHQNTGERQRQTCLAKEDWRTSNQTMKLDAHPACLPDRAHDCRRQYRRPLAGGE